MNCDKIYIYIYREEFEIKKKNLVLNISSFSNLIDNLFDCNKINIGIIIIKINYLMEKLTELYNEYVSILNNIKYDIPPIMEIKKEHINIRYATYDPIPIYHTEIPSTTELESFLKKLILKLNKIYLQIISIPDMIPSLKSVRDIDNELEKNIINLNSVKKAK